MTTTHVYDADQISITFGSILLQGFAEDEVVTVEAADDDFKSKAGCDGLVTRSKTRDQRAKVTVKLAQASPTNDALSAVRTADIAAPNGAGVAPLMIRDRSGRAMHSADAAWISKLPTAAYARESGAREWVFEAAEMKHTIGGNLAVGGVAP